MYTEYNSQNINQSYNNFNQDFNDDDYGKNTKANKFFSVIWKILLVILILVLLFLGLIQFGVISLASDIKPAEVVLNVNEIGIKKGRGYQLITMVLPENANNKQVTYESSDPKIASVNSVSGYIKGLKVGTATIKVKTLINDKETECLVNVQDDGISVQSISLNTKNINLAVGYTYGLSYRIIPTNATELNAIFYSSDPSIATVDSKGMVRGIREGNAIITVSANNGAITDTTYVTIYKKGTTTTNTAGETIKTNNYPTNVKLSSSSLDMKNGTTAQLYATITPSNANSILSWKSSNPSVATVNENGLVQAVGIGTTDIIVTTIDNKTASCKVTVGSYSVNVTKVKILTNYKYMYVGKEENLYVDIEPSNATNRTITWSSSNPSVVSVDNSGHIRAISSGSVTITAKSVDGGHTSTSTIEVGGDTKGIEAKSISFTKPSYEVGVNSTISLSSSINYNPTNTTYKAVNFSSSNTNVATVDNTGLVRGIGIGEATITAVSKQGQATATTKIIVKNIASTGVTLSNTEITLSLNDTFTISASVKPDTASNKTVTFMSRNQNVVTVDKNGMIRAVGSGTAIIDVKPNGGGTASTCTVTVR